jgi:hypothetical protein
MATAAGVTVPNNVTGASVGALVSTIVLWLLNFWHGWTTAPDSVKGAANILIVTGVTWFGGWIEHHQRVKSEATVTPVTKP